jgi:hypothetical protein
MPKNDDASAPGLRLMRRKNGRIDPYWIARPDFVKQGYPVKTVPLGRFGDPNDPAVRREIAAECRRLYADMLEWPTARSSKWSVGTIGRLAHAFQTDPDSPYYETRVDTRTFYDRNIAVLMDDVGDRRLDTITGRDIRKWFRLWKRPAKPGGPPCHRRAYACIQTLRRVASYGCELRDPSSLALAAMLREMAFPAPPGRKSRMLHSHVAAFRAAAHGAGRASMALAVTLQFDLGLRQRDVIGEWVRDPHPPVGSIRVRDWRWQFGLTWDQIDPAWLLTKPTSKSNGKTCAEHDLKLYPDALAELQRIPPERRVGPVVISEKTGLPYRDYQFLDAWHSLARPAGIPPGVRNMDARAGAVSEAFEAGAQAEDVMKAATHTQMSTTMGYNRGSVVQSSRVAELRMKRRKEKGE